MRRPYYVKFLTHIAKKGYEERMENLGLRPEDEFLVTEIKVDPSEVAAYWQQPNDEGELVWTAIEMKGGGNFTLLVSVFEYEHTVTTFWDLYERSIGQFKKALG